MKAVINEVIPGASVIDICSFGDKMILDETAKHYKKDKQLKKGIAFPTCICVNEVFIVVIFIGRQCNFVSSFELAV